MTSPFDTLATGATGPILLQMARIKLGRALLAYLLQHELPDDPYRAALRGSEINAMVMQALAAVDGVIEARVGNSSSKAYPGRKQTP